MFIYKVRDWITNFKLKNRLSKRRFRIVLPLIFLLLLVFGLILTGIYVFVPALVTCSELFAEKFCVPTGIFLALLVNFPGYFVAGNLLPILERLPWGASMAVVIVVSGIIYFLLGYFIDEQKNKKLTVGRISKIIVICVFIIFLILLISLL